MTFYCGPSIVCYQWLQVPTSRVYIQYICLSSTSLDTSLWYFIVQSTELCAWELSGCWLWLSNQRVLRSDYFIWCTLVPRQATLTHVCPTIILFILNIFISTNENVVRRFNTFPPSNVVLWRRKKKKKNHFFLLKIFENNIISIEAAKVLW
jgi:hypothetical protein